MSEKKEVIVVTGATGNIGQPLVSELIKKGYAPRTVVRRIESNAEWNAEQVEQVAVENGADIDALTEAFNGADKVFSLSPLVENFVEFGTATVEAAKRAGVKHIVRSSAQGANVDAPITLGRWHGTVEKIIEDSGIAWTFVQPASFFQNYLGYADTIKTQNKFYAPLGDGKISYVDVRDIASVAAVALTEPDQAGKKYVVTGGEILSNYDIAQIFSEVTGREIAYVDVAEDEARKQMLDSKTPEWLITTIMELNQIGKAGYVAEVFPTIEQVTAKPPRKFRTFVEENKQIFS